MSIEVMKGQGKITGAKMVNGLRYIYLEDFHHLQAVEVEVDRLRDGGFKSVVMSYSRKSGTIYAVYIAR